MALEYQIDINIRYSETDQMGTVHHSSYVLYLEQARVEHLKAIGLPYHEMEKRDIHLPVIELKVEYLKPAMFGEKIKVVSKILPPMGVRLKVEYSLFCREDLVLTGYSMHAFTGKNGKPVRPPKDIIQALVQD
jgi:acyl-CoA thioester hydrolase